MHGFSIGFGSMLPMSYARSSQLPMIWQAANFHALLSGAYET
jgi:hypothetical protein